jgi:hypothetical protein
MREYFVDENSAKGYLVAATLVTSAQRRKYRKALNELRLRGQNRIHFVDERDSRRRKILSVISSLQPSVTIIQASDKNRKEAREQCLIALMNIAAEEAISNVVLERDDSVVSFDERILYREKLKLSHRAIVNFRHESPRQEALLWISDAVAWSFVRGGEWRQRVTSLITNTVLLD